MATDAQLRFHKEWLGLAQPYEGLVFSVPVLADAQIAPEVGADLTTRFKRALVMPEGDGAGYIGDLAAFFEGFLGYSPPGALLRRNELPQDLHFYAQEGGQELRPSFAIARHLPEVSDDLFGNFGDESEAPKPAPPPEANPYFALVWDVRDDGGDPALGLDLDKPEALTGPWRYPPTAKFERLLRAAKVPVGLLCNGHDVRLVYAPAGEATSHLTFRGEFMQRPDGRAILAAFELLLNANRTYRAAAEYTVEGLLKESRSRQADVTKELASQVFEAVELLLAGFEAASRRDCASGRLDTLRAALEAPHDHCYQGVLSVVLRVVFLLYAEDQGVLPVDNETYAGHLSVKGLYDELVEDTGQHPESMHHRFGAYGRLLSLFRAVYFGVEHGELKLPPRRGRLFDPNTFPFLEGGFPGSTSAWLVPEERAATLPPSVDDGTVYEVLHRLIFFQGQRLSYASLNVEQLGSVYESLMGYHVLRATEPAVRLGKNRVWVELGALLQAKPNDRKRLLKDEAGLSAAQVTKVEGLLKEHSELSALGDALNELSPGGKKERHRHRAPAGRLLLQPGEERRRSGSHYTPRSLTEGIVRRTLEPLLKCLGEAPTEAQLLSLKLCDPAMGSGAFLVEVVRQLASEIVEAWTREGRLGELGERYSDPHLHARRLVAQRCVYGVDKNAAAVELAKLSLWLVTLSADLPFTFLDHSLRHGDSLVGLSLDQVSSFHWKPEKQLPLMRKVLDEALGEALEHRAQLLEVAKDDTPRSQEERRRLLDHADQATSRVRMIADLCVGAFFSEEKDKARQAERVRRMDLVERWLKGESALEADLRGMAEEARERLSPFHWMLEFPEVFYVERPDPLDGGKVNGAAFMDGFVGNPPFMGGMKITTLLGPAYRDWLATAFRASSMTDLSAYFFRRTHFLLAKRGASGLVATNTIGQGDSRRYGLATIRRAGGVVYCAVSELRWPGEAAVLVSVVHLCVGIDGSPFTLDGSAVPKITAFLKSTGGDDDPTPLRMNKGIAAIGNTLKGAGFLFDDHNAEATSTAEMRRLIDDDARNASRIFGYLAGEDINQLPQLEPSRWAIDFGSMPEEKAREWPSLFRIVEAKVKPGRARITQRDRRELWWIYATRTPEARSFLESAGRCLVLSQLSAHLALRWVRPGVVCSHSTVLVLLAHYSGFCTLQSRVHERWARRHGSSLEDRLRYTPSDCFETFPFPQPDPRTVIPELETIGERLYETRAKYMVDTDQGLTKTYNALKDPACTDERILHLRALHEEMDRAVLRAYPKLDGVGSTDPDVGGWSDIAVPPFCVASDEDKAALQAFEDEVIDRLFVLNELRAAEEKERRRDAEASPGKEKPKGLKRRAAADLESAEGDPKAKKGQSKDGAGSSGQGRLF